MQVGGFEYGKPIALSKVNRTRKQVLANGWQPSRCRHVVADDDNADGYEYGDDGIPDVLGAVPGTPQTAGVGAPKVL